MTTISVYYEICAASYRTRRLWQGERLFSKTFKYLIQSTYCHTIQEHCKTIRRTCRVINLDPAAETFLYQPTVGTTATLRKNIPSDVRELITAEEVMKEMDLGPNGALIYSMEYMVKKIDWLEETFESSFADDDFILIDCPGQIELYTHHTGIQKFLKRLENWDYRIVGVYCIDVSFATDTIKFISGAMSALSTMLLLEIPHINVLTKFDLLNQTDKDNVNA